MSLYTDLIARRDHLKRMIATETVRLTVLKDSQPPMPGIGKVERSIEEYKTLLRQVEQKIRGFH